jgi:Tfp pilus assembly PilM family ATPase
MSRGVGIEVTDHRVRAVAVDYAPKRLRIVGFHEEAVAVEKDKDPALATAEAIRRAVAAARAGRGRTVASIDSGEAVVRELSLPFKGDDQIKKTVTFELESLIHNYNVEDLVVDFFKTGETEKGTTVLTVAVPKKAIEAKLKVMEAAGVDPVALDVDMAALFNTCHATGGVETDEAFLLVYGTTRFTKMLLVEGRRPKSMRTIRFAFPTRDEIAKEQEERKKARDWQTKDLEGPAPIVILTEKEQERFKALDVEHRSGLIEILAKEISRFLLASAATSTPTHIRLAGDFADDEAVAMLESALQLPVRPLDVLAAAEHPFEKERAREAGMRIAVPVGLALKACDADALGLDFRRGSFSYRRKFEAVKTTALVTLELVVVLLAAVALWFHFEHERWQAGYARMLELHGATYAESTGKEPEDPERAHEDLMALWRKLDSQMGGGGHPIERSALELWNQLFRALAMFDQKHQTVQLGNQKMHALIDSVGVTQSTAAGAESVEIRMSGVVQNPEFFDAMNKEIRAAEPFKEARWVLEPGQLRQTPEGKYRFDVTVRRAKKT